MDSVPRLYERLRTLYQLKHKSSPGRRLTKIEREIGSIKQEIRKVKDANMSEV